MRCSSKFCKRCPRPEADSHSTTCSTDQHSTGCGGATAVGGISAGAGPGTTCSTDQHSTGCVGATAVGGISGGAGAGTTNACLSCCPQWAGTDLGTGFRFFVRFSCSKWQKRQLYPFSHLPFGWKQHREHWPTKCPIEPKDGKSASDTGPAPASVARATISSAGVSGEALSGEEGSDTVSAGVFGQALSGDAGSDTGSEEAPEAVLISPSSSLHGAFSGTIATCCIVPTMLRNAMQKPYW